MFKDQHGRLCSVPIRKCAFCHAVCPGGYLPLAAAGSRKHHWVTGARSALRGYAVFLFHFAASPLHFSMAQGIQVPTVLLDQCCLPFSVTFQNIRIYNKWGSSCTWTEACTEKVTKASQSTSKAAGALNAYWNVFLGVRQRRKKELHLAFQLWTKVLDSALWGWDPYSTG